MAFFIFRLPDSLPGYFHGNDPSPWCDFRAKVAFSVSFPWRDWEPKLPTSRAISKCGGDPPTPRSYGMEHKRWKAHHRGRDYLSRTTHRATWGPGTEDLPTSSVININANQCQGGLSHSVMHSVLSISIDSMIFYTLWEVSWALWQGLRRNNFGNY